MAKAEFRLSRDEWYLRQCVGKTHLWIPQLPTNDGDITPESKLLGRTVDAHGWTRRSNVESAIHGWVKHVSGCVNINQKETNVH